MIDLDGSAFLANDPPFPSPLFFSSAENTVSFFSSTINLFPSKSIFSDTRFTPYFLSQVCSLLKKYFPSPNIIFLFHIHIIFPKQKRIPSLNIILLLLLCSSFPPQTRNSKKNSKIMGQNTHNLLDLAFQQPCLITLASQFFFSFTKIWI